MVTWGIIRHARTRWNLEKKLQGSADIPLSTEGIRDAALWGDLLKAQKFDLILSSPMIRAKQTAGILSDALGAKIVYDRDLREQDFGTWEGCTLTDIRTHTPGAVELEESRGWDFCPPEGESRMAVLKRASRAVDAAQKRFDRKKILMVTHSSVMKILIYKALDRAFTPDEAPILKPYHLHGMTCQGRMRVHRLNSIQLALAQGQKH